VFSDTFSLQFALTFVVMLIVGGQGSIPGVILGTIVVTLSPYLLSGLTGLLPPTLPITAGSKTTSTISNGLYRCWCYCSCSSSPAALRRTRSCSAHGVAPADRDGDRPALPVAVRVVVEQTPELRQVLDVRDLRLVYRTGARALDGIGT
jgi:hypothetical protein